MMQGGFCGCADMRHVGRGLRAGHIDGSVIACMIQLGVWGIGQAVVHGGVCGSQSAACQRV